VATGAAAAAVALLSLTTATAGAGLVQGRAVFDHTYAALAHLLTAHVRWLPDGAQSRVDYRGAAADRANLSAVLAAFSAVERTDFAGWTRDEQFAFLVNAYNAFTLDLVLTRWPNLTSIRDLGSLLRSPWRRRFFTLLGAPRHLDWIEHDQLRARYGDPRVHVAVNCASVGCPALRPEPFVAARLDEQLEDSMRRFLGDRTRNRVTGRRLEVSAIFKWYRDDFAAGHGGVPGVAGFLGRYADALSHDPAEQAALRRGAFPVTYLPYDWSLNALLP